MRMTAAAICVGIGLGMLEASAQTQTPEDGAKARKQRQSQADRSAEFNRRADVNADGKLSFEELRTVNPQLTEERFKRMDTDGNGFLTEAERRKFQRAINQNQRIHRQMLTKVLESDRDGDGKVSYEELIHAKPGFPRVNFDQLDLNRDGILTDKDMRRPQRAGVRTRPIRAGDRQGNRGPQDREAFMRRMQSADTDKNGKITFDELRGSFPRITEERFRQMDRNGDGILTRGEGPQRPQPR